MSLAVADTSALLIDPAMFKSYSKVFLPYEVVSELDRLKVERSRRGRLSSKALRYVIDNLELFSILAPVNLPADDAVISIGAKQEATVVSADIALVLRAKSFGLATEFIEQKGDDFQDTFFEAYSESFEPVNGSYGILHTEKSDRLAHYWNGDYRFVKEHILRPGKKIVAPQDARQTCFIHSIFDKDIKFVASTGVPGSGKTYLALAAALQLVQRGEYDRIILSVPSEHIGGKDRYGYAPGDLDDKMFNFSRGILDNLTQLVPEMTFSDLKSVKSNLDFVDVQPLYLVRGRNLDRAIVILDEAQNIDLYTMRVLATRITDQSKLVVCGDIYQSDVQYRCQIGLKQCIEKFRSIDHPKPVFAHINLNHSQRGEFSELAWRLLQ